MLSAVNRGADNSLETRAEELFRGHQRDISRRADRLFAVLLPLEWLACVAAAIWISPLTWVGLSSQTHPHVWTALLLGGAIVSLPLYMALRHSGTALTRHVVAVGQMLMSGLLIHLTGGRIETHFHVFGSLAFLAFYRDWRILLPATAVVAADHFLRGIFWPQSVFGVLAASPWRWLEHAGWVLFEDTFLIIAIRQSRLEMGDMARQRAELEATQQVIEAKVIERTNALSAVQLRLRESETRLRATIECAGDGILTIDGQGRIESLNGAAERMFGREAAELAGCSADQLFDESGRTVLQAAMRALRDAPYNPSAAERRETAVVRSDGTSLPVELNLSRMTAQEPPTFIAVVHDISQRRQAARQLEELQKQHLEVARRIGMAEIATSVLHNVGNVLNSVNVAASVINDKVRKSATADLGRAISLLELHRDDVADYIARDAQGKHLPGFIVEVGRKLAADEEEILAEVVALTKNIDHIKDIVTVQQSYVGMSGTVEKVSLEELIQDAIRINSASLGRHEVEVVYTADDLPEALVSRQKFLQVVVNVLSNAKYAVMQNGRNERRIDIDLRKEGEDRARLEIRDNGIGIAPENLTRIFAHGFTTRKEGHGFGLHSAANLAQEMGAELSVHSDGVGRGATFVLSFPLDASQQQPLTVGTA